ncbi:MAG: cardiolipin synthase B [Candidatus Rokuibacteriota bacterium]|nr:MAG: cardiolipin synthase B [Candidatus Rokubacteria bacterium]
MAPDVQVGQPAFVRAMEAHTLSGLVQGNRAEVLVNGDQIFPAMLAAIRGARTTITFANFVYEDGAIAREMAEALAERCRAGVGVSVLVDAVGSSKMPKALRRMLSESGCHFARYQPVNPFALKRFNHRNHRRILVVDGRIGFTGGTGIGEKWTGDGRQEGHWRQTDVRVEGPIVRFLQAAFVEDWREATTLLLAGDAYFPPLPPRGDLAIQSVKSSPASGATEAYLLFLLAIDAARSSIKLTNPYFVPDDRMAQALAAAAHRGVEVTVITAGAVGSTLDRLVRKASLAHFGRALRAGVKIHEYGPGLLHAKTMVVDDQWVSIGSANLDNRSFAINNELNVTFLDRRLARRLTEIFEADLTSTKPVALDDWKRHSVGYLFYLPLVPLRDQL